MTNDDKDFNVLIVGSKPTMHMSPENGEIVIVCQMPCDDCDNTQYLCNVGLLRLKISTSEGLLLNAGDSYLS